MTKDIKHNDPYKNAGVDINAGNDLIDKIKNDVVESHSPNVIGNFGGFAGMFSLGKDYEDPVLVACTDGVGTKVSLAQEINSLDFIGQDLVAMCVNDLIVCGAKPLFFLDYFASSKLNVDEAAKIIKSIAKACNESECSLLGGETAEMPGHYLDNNFDLAGFAVGCVDRKKIIDNNSISSGDILVGIESSGPHSNGFSLIRKILKDSNLDEIEYKKIANLAIKPTLLYPKLITHLIEKYALKGMAHITGGGLLENIPRSIPDNLCAEIYNDSWHVPEIFSWLKNYGNLQMEDMYRIFNCGIGMVLIVDKTISKKMINSAYSFGFKAYEIGHIKEKFSNNQISII